MDAAGPVLIRPRSAALAAGAVALLALTGLPGAAPDAAAGVCGGQRYDRVGAGGPSPYVRLDADGRPGLFLIDYGATRSSLWQDAAAAPASGLRMVRLGLPGVGAAPFFLRPAAAAPAEGARGVIGTDLLSQLTVAFADGAIFIGAARCDPAALRAEGFAPIAQAGFFGPAPLNDGRHPNVPVAFIGVADVVAWAQIDTGYDDRTLVHSVDINRALFDRLQAAGVALEPAGTIRIATCDGGETRAVYSIAGGPLTIEDESGAPLAQVDRYSLILKTQNRCGGIAALAEPAAQLGASYLEAFDEVVIDALSQTVWVRSTR